MIWILAIAFAFLAAVVTHQLAKADRRYGESGSGGDVHVASGGDGDASDGGGDGGGGDGGGGGGD